MAIIKCPECGHQISDKAPTCPNCGVEIAGKITECPHCGNIYFKEDGICPHCNKPYDLADDEETTNKNTKTIVQNDYSQADDAAESLQETEAINDEKPPVKNDNNGKKKSKNKTILLVSFIIAVVIVGVGLFFYFNAENGKEEEEYKFALGSNDPMILQTYLDNFKSAPQEHIDTIMVHLQRLSLEDVEWTDAVVSGTKSALNEYLKKYPDTQHRQEILDKIDSIDWMQTSNINTIEAYQAYIDNHYDGGHYDEAMIALNKIKSNEINANDRILIRTIFHNFFVSINSRDEASLIADVNDDLTFLGKVDATRTDVISFMNKLYKPDVQSMIWTLANDYDIQKKEADGGLYEYTVRFMATQKVQNTDNTSINNFYRIDANVNSQGKITEMSMTKIVD